jgi:large subunit ribosomal protein L21
VSTYAIVESGGRQYRAEKGEIIVVDRLPADEGSKVTLRAVMYRGDKKVVLDGGELEKVKVEARVAEHLRGPKVRIFKYRPKKGYRRRAGHRSELTKLEVTDVRMLTRKPAGQAKTARKPAAKREPAKKEPAKRGSARKPAQKRTTAGKSASRSEKSSGSRRTSAKKEA